MMVSKWLYPPLLTFAILIITGLVSLILQTHYQPWMKVIKSID